ncbi:hypothetical protein G7Y89_g10667 [Cudoniella acicularis]|uniref:Heterokaryon incompatibility domain-containing protein n=1 Tax=Cudoniella acicularis TaxID=354080 RepID=A0A8H4RDE2_9HELO|nr:hypothetical protein G7Y89_g10667 [Cudoniella acicularis]
MESIPLTRMIVSQGLKVFDQMEVRSFHCGLYLPSYEVLFSQIRKQWWDIDSLTGNNQVGLTSPSPPNKVCYQVATPIRSINTASTRGSIAMPRKHDIARYQQLFPEVPEHGVNSHTLLLILLRWSWAGILHALLIEAFFPGSTLTSPLWFLIISLLRPARSWTLITTLFQYFINDTDDLEPNGDERFLQAVANTTGYWLTIAACRMGSFMWYCLQALMFWQPISFYSSILVFWILILPLRLNILPQILPPGAYRLLISIENAFLLGIYNGIQGLWRLVRWSAQHDPIFQALRRLLPQAFQFRIRWDTETQLVENLPDFDYKEASLPDTEHFRILKLEARKPFTAIEAILLPVPLLGSRSYRCISYVWGTDTVKSHVIRLNGKNYRVTPNVYCILRSQTSMWRANYIWIDSICIDQRNDHEKSFQVRMMREIYAQAAKVVIWLGEPADAKWAIYLLNELRFLKLAAGPEKCMRWVDRQRSVILDSEITAAKWRAFLELLNHPWFERVWVIQELASAKAVDVSYGGSSVPWSLFLTDLSIVHREEMKDVFGLFQGSGVSGLATQVKDPLGPKNAFIMSDLRELLSRGELLPLHTVLIEFLSWKATKGVDKIFALLPLTVSAYLLQDLIDYTKPVSEVLVHISRHLMREQRELGHLHFAGIGWGSTARDPFHNDLPSWVVDWTVSRVPASLSLRLVGEEARLYDTALNEAQFIKMSSGLDSILLHGIHIDSIQHLGPEELFPSTFDMRDVGRIDHMISWLENYDIFIRQWAVDPYVNGQSLHEATSRLLIGDRTAATRPAPKSHGNYIMRFLSAARQVRRFLDGHVGEYIGETPNDPTAAEFHEVMEKWREVIGSVHDADVIFQAESFPRRVCVTKYGYLAAVPMGSQPGDVVAALFAMSVPFVLRPSEIARGHGIHGIDEDGNKALLAPGTTAPSSNVKHYQLVGECYCHGMMDREAFKLGHEQESLDLSSADDNASCNTPSQDSEFAFDHDSDGDDGNEEIDITSRASMSSIASISRTGATTSNSSMSSKDESEHLLSPSSTFVLFEEDSISPLTSLGNISSTSIKGCQLGLDWALIEILNLSTLRNRHSTRSDELLRGVSPRRFVQKLERDAAILAITGFSGIFRGRISSTTTMVRLSPRSTFQEVRTLEAIPGHGLLMPPIMTCLD